uniref:TIGR02117 family protein n=1 Tax=Flavobacterium sp. TaxID=239 RepID=UPI00404983BA
MLKKTFKFIGKTLLFLVGFVVLYLISAYAMSRITVDEEVVPNREIAIYIKTNGVHTDIVVPVRNAQIDWSEKIKFEHTIQKDATAQFVALGWGDKGFYLETPEWADLKASVALKAATGIGSTAIHATFYSNIIESETCKKILISTEQYARLITYVENSFKKDENNNYINISTDANYGKTDAFYEANGSYSLFHTCNTWANNGLKSSGQKCCLWTPFDTGIFLKYNNK